MRRGPPRAPCAAPAPRPSRCSWPTNSPSATRAHAQRRAAGRGPARRVGPLRAARCRRAAPCADSQQRYLHILDRMPDRAQLEGRTTELLQRLIRFNTVNPPGNEQAAQEFLKGLLEGAGFECELLADVRGPPEPGGARCRPAPTARACAYLGHVDTVLADPGEWTRGPVVGRAARRLRVGPRRARHEEPGGGRGRRGADARRGGLAAASPASCCWSLTADEETGADPRRAAGSASSTRTGCACDMVVNEGAGEVVRVRRPPPLRRVRRREGRLPLHAHHVTDAPATPRSRASATTRW